MGDVISEQILKLPYYSPWNMSSSPSAILAQKVAQLSPSDFNHLFFTMHGSTAIDSTIRFVHFFNNVLGHPQKKIVLSREKAYHGSTYFNAILCGNACDKNWMDTSTLMLHFLSDVNPSLRQKGQNLEAFLNEKINNLDSSIQTLDKDKVGAFIAEPILASDGVIIPPEGYHKRCLEVCRKYEVLYISDEVVTGFGCLDHWYASKEVFGIEPDIITSAKGLTSGYVPLGVCIISDLILSKFSGKQFQGAIFSNGFTYSGHPVTTATLKNLEILENEGSLEHVCEISQYFLECLTDLNRLPLVRETRGLGLVVCVECRFLEPENPEVPGVGY